jgi:hypothetical protein
MPAAIAGIALLISAPPGMNDETAGSAFETNPPIDLAMLLKGHAPTGFPNPSYKIWVSPMSYGYSAKPNPYT